MAEATAGHWPTPVARSYDGQPWESLYAPPGQSRVAVTCAGVSACSLALPADTPSGYAYRVDVYVSSTVDGGTSPNRTRRREAAKWLLQTTFGPRREEVDVIAEQLSGSASDAQVFANWVDSQIELPMSSHRVYYRERLNSRTTYAGRLACEPMSRWHRFSFTSVDVRERVNITVSIDAIGVRSISVGDVLRTQVADWSEFDAGNTLGVGVGSPWRGYLCRVGERVGGFFTTSWGWHHRGGIGLDTDPGCIRDAPTLIHLHHPPLYFQSPDPSTTLVLESDEAVLVPIPWVGRTYDLGRGGSFVVGGPVSHGAGASVTHEEVFIMTERKAPCTLSHASQEQRGHAFLLYNGTACARLSPQYSNTACQDHIP